jgi:hypothetical protein
MTRISETIIDKYLHPLSKKRGDDLTMEEIEKIFIHGVEDFKKEELFLEELSGICNYLWSIAVEKSQTDQKLSNFTDILLRCSEISYYIHNAENEETGKILALHLKEILNYSK